MAVGQAVITANSILEAEWGGPSWAGHTSSYARLHTGDPGASGTANESAEALRRVTGFGSPSGGSIEGSTSPWLPWVVGTETITHVSFWTNVDSGWFFASGALSIPRTLENGDTIELTVLVSLGPIAA